jgi:hypothetical protein
MGKAEKQLVIFVHTLLIILLYASPFWLSWKLILILIVLNYLQLFLFGGCVLTIRQFRSVEISFQEWLLDRLGVKVDRPKFNRFLKWQLPFILLALSLLWQEVLGFAPLIKL